MQDFTIVRNGQPYIIEAETKEEAEKLTDDYLAAQARDVPTFAANQTPPNVREAPTPPMTWQQGLGLVNQGISLNLADEAMAGAQTIASYPQTMLGFNPQMQGKGPFERYDMYAEQLRAPLRQARRDYPGRSTAIEGVSGIATGVLGTGRQVGKQGFDVIQDLAARSEIGENVSRMAGDEIAKRSATEGLASGYGASESDDAVGLLSDTVEGGAYSLGMTRGMQKAGADMRGVPTGAAYEASPDYARNVKIMEDAGVPLTGGQKSGSAWQKASETTLRELFLVGGPIQKRMDETSKAFGRKLFKLIGYDENRPGSLNSGIGQGKINRSKLDDVYDYLSEEYRETLRGKEFNLKDGELNQALKNLQLRYEQALTPEDREYKRIGNLIKAFEKQRDSGRIYSGDDYQQYRSTLLELETGQNAEIIGNFRRIIDKSFERQHPNSGLRELNSQFAQFKQLENMYNTSGDGYMSPRILAGQARRNPGSREWEEFTQAAADVVPDTLGNSGTATRSRILEILGYGGVGVAGMMEPGFLIPPALARAFSTATSAGIPFSPQVNSPVRTIPGGVLSSERAQRAVPFTYGALFNEEEPYETNPVERIQN